MSTIHFTDLSVDARKDVRRYLKRHPLCMLRNGSAETYFDLKLTGKPDVDKVAFHWNEEVRVRKRVYAYVNV